MTYCIRLRRCWRTGLALWTLPNMATTTFSTVTIPPGGTSGNVREGEEEGREGGWVKEEERGEGNR